MKPKPTILVADDEVLSRTILGETLKAAGFDVVYAVNGQEVLDLVARQRPELVLMDMMMPVLDGKKACQRLKINPDTADLPVLMVTVRDTIETVRELEAVGADGYFLKPPSTSRLLREIDAALKKQQFKLLSEKLAPIRVAPVTPISPPGVRGSVSERTASQPRVPASGALPQARAELSTFLETVHPLFEKLQQKLASLDAADNPDFELRRLARKLDGFRIAIAKLRKLAKP